MRRLGVAPQHQYFDRPATNDWLKIIEERFNIYTGTADPTTAEVPQGQWIMYYNTTSGELRYWANLNGVMKKTAALT